MVAVQLKLDLPLEDISDMLDATADPETVLLNVATEGADRDLVEAVVEVVASNLDKVIGELDNRGESNYRNFVLSRARRRTQNRLVLDVCSNFGELPGGGLGVVVALLRTQFDTSFRSPGTGWRRL